VNSERRQSGPLRREIPLTVVALAVTCVAAVFGLSDVLAILVERAGARQWASTVAQGTFLVIVTYLIYGACVYHVARLGHLRRLIAHVPVAVDDLRRVYREPDAPLLTVLVPSCMEDERVIRRTVLCAALQEYPRRRVVLLIDDAPSPANARDAASLDAARRLPRFVESILEDPKKRADGSLSAFLDRSVHGREPVAAEYARLAECCVQIASWFDEQADAYEIVDHADALFVETTLRRAAREYRQEAASLAAFRPNASRRRRRDVRRIEVAYRRLVARFDVEVVSFERKRYENVSHEPNKATNLNSYIGLLGHSVREVEKDGALFLEPTERQSADLTVPESEFLLVVDADSILTPDYALRLVHLMRSPGNERVAVAQTPYSAFPGAPGTPERIAGATTDIQYLVHQGFTQYGGTYWVGANAVIRTSALRDIATTRVERGFEIRTFIHDRTVIEDTESTVDLLSRGWRLHNYPDRLAYSETPPDFGSLLIQRRRWANGGLLMHRHRGHGRARKARA
jgi:cellulose synthase (UDP-forming)